MGAIQDGQCRRCLGVGSTMYHGTEITCPTCHGTRARPLTVGDRVYGRHGVIVGTLEYDDDSEQFYTGNIIAPANMLPDLVDVRTDEHNGQCDAP